jgi:8-oxo-dGTP diphosphatase
VSDTTGPPAPQVAVGAVVVRDGRLLAVRRGRPPAQGRWTLPGGRVEPGEAVLDAVVREVAEETGLPVTVGELLGWWEHLDDDHHYVILDFLAQPAGSTDAVAGDDAAEVAWMTRSQLLEAGTTDGLLGLLDERGVTLAP